MVFHSDTRQEICNTDRREIVHQFEVHIRDLRSVFSLRQLISIVPRGKGIVVNLGILKMVIGQNKVFIFNLHHSEVSETFTDQLTQAIKDNDAQTPFQFLVLETALAQRFRKFRTEYEILETDTENALRETQNLVNNQSIETLLNLKKRLSKFETTITEMNEALIDLLDDDEELRHLYLQEEPPEDTEEIESVLEFFAEPAEEIMHKIEDLKENIDDTQEFLDLKLSNLRNDIIRFDLFATIATTIFSFLAVITGIYGMNVRNNVENSFDSFVLLITLMILTAITMFIWFWRYMKRKKIL